MMAMLRLARAALALLCLTLAGGALAESLPVSPAKPPRASGTLPSGAQWRAEVPGN